MIKNYVELENFHSKKECVIYAFFVLDIKFQFMNHKHTPFLLSEKN